MATVLKTLSSTIKKIIEQFPDNQKAISFLIATGCHQQGISTLLKQTQMQQVHLDEEHNIDLFFNKNGIILEINEDWIKNSTINLSTLFKKINRCHRKIKISGFLFFLDINEIINLDEGSLNSSINNHVIHFKSFISALEYTVRSGLIITKLDQITGFTDFFSSSHDLELKEPMGFSLSYSKAQTKFATIFSDAWSNFVSHLNQLMIQKVHTTRANKKRILIREFPLQIALLEINFINLLKKINHERTLIHSIYFTSSEQKGKNINYLNEKIQNDFSLLVPIVSSQSVNYKQYFITGAIQHSQELTSFTPKPKLFQDKTSQIILASGFIISLYITFQTINTLKLISQTKYEIKHHSLPQDWQNSKELFNLEITLERLNKLPLIFRYLDKVQLLEKNISEIELNIYQNKIAAEIIKTLNVECQKTNIAQSYNALRVYKALQQKRLNEEENVITWFKELWSENTNKTQTEQYTKLLKKFMWKISWPIDKNIIINTENILNSIDQTYLIYSLIEPKIMGNTYTIELPGFENNNIIIPSCFERKNFHRTINTIFDNFEQFNSKSWILNKKFDESIKDELVEKYAQKYVHWWLNISKFIRPKNFSSFTEAKNLFKTLRQENTFEKILLLIEKQTGPNIKQANDTFNHLVAVQFPNIHFSNTENKLIKDLWRENEKFVGMLNVFNENGNASFQYMRTYFNQTQYNDALYTLNEYTKRAPQPLNIWLNQINDNIWSVLQETTKNYLNQAWQENIVEDYKNHIKDLYPFSENKSEVNIEEFEKFFSPSGKIQKFFRDYLQPFINTSQAQWIPKEINNRRFPIPEKTIQQFIQTNIISTMFFPNNSSKTQVLFSIEKISLDPMINLLELRIGNKKIRDNQQNNIYEQSLEWPSSGASLNINTIDGDAFKIEEEGQWGLFRLLEQTNIISDPTDASALQILLEINGNSGRYILKTINPINPFLPSLLKKYQLEELLIK